MEKSVAIIGANGAIGSNFIKKYISDNSFKNIYAFSRVKPENLDSKVIWTHIDYFHEDVIRDAVKVISHKLDVIVVATGILHTNTIYPEKSLKELSMVNMQTIFTANTIAPALIAKHFIPYLATDRKALFAVLSARVGSINDNKLGGWFSYRSSKAALNMLIKNIAIEYCRFHKKAVIVGLHPGTVDSYLSEPFKDKIPPEKVFTPEYSVTKMLEVIQSLTPEDSGFCYAYDGSRIDY